MSCKRISGELSLLEALPAESSTIDSPCTYSLPMMDLLVQVASRNRLKPGEHAISVISEETGRTIDYQSSQTIGSLAVNKIFLINKSMQKKQRESEIQRHKDASKFEVCGIPSLVSLISLSSILFTCTSFICCNAYLFLYYTLIFLLHTAAKWVILNREDNSRKFLCGLLY